MNLYVLRHAIAEERDPKMFADDSLRPLSAKGIKRMERIAQGMRALALSFDVIYTSPFTRAHHTARIVADAFKAQKRLRLTDTLAVGGDPKELCDLIDKENGADANVLIVGHEPYLSDLISVLLVGDSSLAVTMKKGGLCKLGIDSLSYGQCATLEWLVPPAVAVHVGNE